MVNRFTVTLPDIGEGVVEGEVIEWLKEIGDSLKQDEPVVVVMTDKATVELPAPHPGRLSKKYYHVGEIAIKGQPLYEIETESAFVEKSEQKGAKLAPPLVHQTPTSKEDKVLATPATRVLAKKLGLDINTIQVNEEKNRVTKEEIAREVRKKHRGVQSKFPTFSDDEIQPVTGIRRLMVENMTLAKQEAAHFSYFEQVDVTRLVQLRQNFKAKAQNESVNVTFVPFIIKALSLALNQYPLINSNINSETYELIIHKQHHIGIAMTTELGLIVPVLKNVETMTLEQIIRHYEILKAEALSKKLSSKHMKGSTFTISNFGVLGGGGMWATPVLNFPEVGILAFAKIHKQPIVKNDELMVRDVLNLSWSFDHRVIDGDMAAHFSHYFAELLQNPAPLI